MTIVIIFFGLMVHVNQPFSLDNTVVIPRAADHQPELHIPGNAVQNPDNPWVKQFYSARKHEYVIPLTGRKFRVQGTRGIFTDKHPTFFAAALRLGRLAPNCDLRPDVRDRQITDEVASYIDYRGGRVTTESYFYNLLELQSGPLAGERNCVACKTRYEAELERDEAQLVFGDAQVVRIAGNSAIEVKNIPSSTSDSGGHFSHNYVIFRDGCMGPDTKPVGECKNTPICKDAAPFHGRRYPDADCTNTTYP